MSKYLFLMMKGTTERMGRGEERRPGWLAGDYGREVRDLQVRNHQHEVIPATDKAREYLA